MSPRDRIGEAISAIVAPESGAMPRVSATELNHQLLRASLKAVGKKLSGSFDDEERRVICERTHFTAVRRVPHGSGGQAHARLAQRRMFWGCLCGAELTW